MLTRAFLAVATLWLGPSIWPASAGIQVVFERNDGAGATRAFHFEHVPPPSRSDAATTAKFSIIDGQRDANGAGVEALHDGQLPSEADQPGRNFFFAAGSLGGRIGVDLGRRTSVAAINSYSWHPQGRGPQVYRVYGAAGEAPGFQPEPRRETDPEKCGWQRLAAVDTRPAAGSSGGGGQYGVHIADPDKPLGDFRYLLFDISPTDSRDAFGQTFYSEIDVVEPGSPGLTATNDDPPAVTRQFTALDGRYHFTIDTTVATDLTAWAEQELQPVVQTWYPRLVELLPSEGFTARSNVTIRFRENMGGTPASAGGGVINCNAPWFRRELKREAIGSVVHEMVHVVQSYGRIRRDAAGVTRMPGWLVEGIPDYIRWFLYEPQTHGAEITARNLERARYDASYRITGNFLDWVTRKYDTNIVPKLNAAGRAGQYREDLWKEATGRTMQELGDEWRKDHQQRLAPKESTK